MGVRLGGDAAGTRLAYAASVDLPAPPPLLTRIRPAWWSLANRIAAAGYGAGAVLLLAKRADGVLPVLGAIACAAAVAWPIAARARRARAALAVSLAAFGVITVWQPRCASAALVPLGCVLYTMGSGARPRTAVCALLAALGAAGATALPDFKHGGAAGFFGASYITLWTIGFAVGMHRRSTALALRGQAQIARGRLDQARRELVEQRMRIARELHDVVAHHMSVITVQAGYGGLVLEQAVSAPSVASARAALGVIETTGRQALDEMRRLVEVLRAQEDAEAGRWGSGSVLAPAPGLGDVPRLLEYGAHAGVHVTVITAGNPRPLPAGEDLAAYRIVQEALTNVIKHAGGAATLRLEYGERTLTIEVTNGPSARSEMTRPAQNPQAGEGEAGRGTAGMRERALLYGGDLEARPTGDGGFRVTARLPLPAAEQTGAFDATAAPAEAAR